MHQTTDGSFSVNPAPDHRPLFERFRPTRFEDVIGQDKIVKRLQVMAARSGLAGRAFWVSGKSGQGKTTLARLIAATVADELFTEELDAQDLTPAKLKDLERSMQCRAWGKGGKAYIVNESHGLSKASVRQLLVLIERLPAHCVIVFTTTLAGQEMLFEACDDSSPLLSRCIVLELAQRDLSKAFAEKAREIAQAEGLDGRSIEHYVRLVQFHRGNLRAVLQSVEAGEMLA